jgi:hypothetical protein
VGNNYSVVFKPGNVIGEIDIVIDEDSVEAESDFTNCLLMFTSVCKDGIRREIYVNSDDILGVLPISIVKA